MEGFQTWHRGSQPLILDINQATCKRPRLLSLICSFNFPPATLEVKNPLATAICRESSLEKDPSSKNEGFLFQPHLPFTWTSKHTAPDGIFVSLRHVAEAVLDLRVLRIISNGLTHGEQRLPCCN